MDTHDTKTLKGCITKCFIFWRVIYHGHLFVIDPITDCISTEIYLHWVVF